MEIWLVKTVPIYVNHSTLSKELSPIFPLFCPVFWSRKMTIYLVFSAFTSKPIPLLATTKSSVFFLIVLCSYPICQRHQHKLQADEYCLTKRIHQFYSLFLNSPTRH
jgi:hypothetical protein